MTTDRAESLLTPRATPVLPFMALSVGGHVLAIAGLTVFSWLFSGPKVELEQKPITASLVQLGKKRDAALLPRKEAPPPPPAAQEKVAPAPAPAPVEKAVALPSNDVKPVPKKEQVAKSGEKEAPRSFIDALKQAAREAKPEEVEGAEDGDRNGDSAKQQGERYYALLSAVVKRNYDVSDTIPEAERRTLKATVVIKLGAQGELLDVDLTRSSGNETFDAAVVGAVRRAAPFGAPPAGLRDTLKGGVTLNFTP